MFQWAVLWTAMALCALLVAERMNSRVGVWLTKPAASLGFVLGALLVSDGASAMAPWMLAALVACALGDVLLIPQGRGPLFLAGVGAFAIGHALYAYAFWALHPQAWASAIGAAVMLGVAWKTLRWLGSHVEAPLDHALRGYIAIIGLMVALAVGASAATGDVRFAIGAIAFAISDLSVARDRFVRASFINVAWGLPLYYAAQLVLASTAAGVADPSRAR